MSQQSILTYKKNMSANGLGAQYYEIINCALTSKEGLSPIIIKDSGSAGLTLNRETVVRAKQISIEQKTLNSIVKEYGIKPAFIKMDVEGMGMDCLLGSMEIIKEVRPALSIAIYHNPIEFFEIKPFLQQELPNYSFIIRKLSNLITNNSCHAETILLAYPNQ